VQCAGFFERLGANSSLDLVFQNSSYNQTDVKVILLPAIQPGQYDGTKSLSAIISVWAQLRAASVYKFFSGTVRRCFRPEL